MKYAGFWKRLLAFLLDQIILGFARMIIFIPLWIIFLASLFGEDFLNNDYHIKNVGFVSNDISIATFAISVFLIIILVVINFVFEWLYFSLMESSSKQGTLGKIIVGIKVTDLEGKKISFGKACGRYFGKIISGIIFMIGFIIAGITKRKQALHDLIAGTLVIDSINLDSYSSLTKEEVL